MRIDLDRVSTLVNEVYQRQTEYLAVPLTWKERAHREQLKPILTSLRDEFLESERQSFRLANPDEDEGAITVLVNESRNRLPLALRYVPDPQIKKVFDDKDTYEFIQSRMDEVFSMLLFDDLPGNVTEEMSESVKEKWNNLDFDVVDANSMRHLTEIQACILIIRSCIKQLKLGIDPHRPYFSAYAEKYRPLIVG